MSLAEKEDEIKTVINEKDELVEPLYL